jgi:hypothetical protein
VKGKGPNGWPWNHTSYQEGWRWAPESRPGAGAPTVNETAEPAVVLYDAGGKPLTRKRVAGFIRDEGA